jgi:cysteine desulfurase family protein (TIGR01976 family)
VQFPALRRRVNGVPVAYFDGPGGTQVPQRVVDAMTEYLLHHNANSHWHYPTSIETDEVIASGRAAMADLLGCSPDEIAFGQNMTSLTFHVSRALARPWGPGDEIVVTELDHHGNVDPWVHAARDCGATVRTVPVSHADRELISDELEAAFTPRTKLVAIGAASNAIGTIPDVAHVVRLARSVGALVYVDAVHAVPHATTDVKALDCDFLACSAYKFYGPHIGVLYGKRDLLSSLDVPKLRPSPDTAPERIETGTQNHEAIAGAAGAVDFLASIGSGMTRREALVDAFAKLHAKDSLLVSRLWDGLSSIPSVTLYGRKPGTGPRTPTVAFAVDGMPSAQVAEVLAGQALFVTDGNFYAETLVSKLGHAHDGVVRAGCACYTTTDEVDRLVDAVRSLKEPGR